MTFEDKVAPWLKRECSLALPQQPVLQVEVSPEEIAQAFTNRQGEHKFHCPNCMLSRTSQHLLDEQRRLQVVGAARLQRS